MTRSIRPATCLSALLCMLGALAQSAIAQTDDASLETFTPVGVVAFVYVVGPNNILGFAAASDGKLKPLPGSPYAGQVSSLSVTKNFLFATSVNGYDIYSYSIASTGALHLVSTTDALNYNSGSGPYWGACEVGLGPLKIDYSSSTLYTLMDNCPSSWYTYQAFKIESTGDLQYVGATASNDANTRIIFLGTNQYAYAIGCFTEDEPEQFTETYKRESSGLLKDLGSNPLPLPAAQDANNYFYCPATIQNLVPAPPQNLGNASDPSNHLAVALQETGYLGPWVGPIVLASYTGEADGTLTTTNTWKNLAKTAQESTVLGTSISPTGKLLAVGGKGFQVFHFNGAAPITNFTQLLEPGYDFASFAWDSSNHLYAVGKGHELFVYTATPTGVTAATGSPYSIPGAGQVIVLAR